MATIIKVFYGDTPLYVADLYQLCINDGRYDFTLSESIFFAHDFPSISSAMDFAETYLNGRKVEYIVHRGLDFTGRV